MKKRVLRTVVALAVSAAMLAGCGSAANEATEQTSQEEVTEAQAPVTIEAREETEKVTEETAEISDEEKASEVAALIDAIYVQKWTEETDDLCAQARAAWDALSDAQKDMVEGEFADPDYFGRDTGDAWLMIRLIQMISEKMRSLL